MRKYILVVLILMMLHVRSGRRRQNDPRLQRPMRQRKQVHPAQRNRRKRVMENPRQRMCQRQQARRHWRGDPDLP